MSILTDGSGVSALTSSKVLKDLVADFLLTLVATLVASNVLSVQDAVTAPAAVGFGIAGAAFHAGFRFVMRWTNS